MRHRMNIGERPAVRPIGLVIAAAVLMSLCAMGLAAGDDGAFQARVDEAKRLENTADGQAFVKQWYGQIGEQVVQDYRDCRDAMGPAGKSGNSANGHMTLVADVMAGGRVGRVEIRPADSALAQCVAQRFGRFTLPAPPTQPQPWPVTIDFNWAG
jgi:hypothetical protein